LKAVAAPRTFFAVVVDPKQSRSSSMEQPHERSVAMNHRLHLIAVTMAVAAAAAMTITFLSTPAPAHAAASLHAATPTTEITR
jgi:hypothetical protein